MKNQEPLPDHLIPLPGDALGRWALWRDVCVRGAGFPAADVLPIADVEAAAAADRWNAARAEAEALREAALTALRGELEAAGKERLDLLVKAIRKVKRDRPPATAGLAPETAAAIDAWQAAAGRAAAQGESFAAAYAAAEERIDGELRRIAGDDRFREAVLWQNRHAAETGLAAFLRRPAGAGHTSARDRGHAQLLASYLQRYAVKNDTIGFFGPVGWARLNETGEAVAARPGPGLLTSRQVFFEGWAIDALADRLAEDEAMRPWLSPRLSPFIRRENGAFFTPDGQQIPLGPLSTAFLSACDGTLSAQVMMRRLAAATDLPPDKEALLWGLLANLHQEGALRWGFQIPLTPTPERTLRELLEAIEEAPLRDGALALLDELEQGREAVVKAAGNPDELARAMAELEASFTRMTGKAATQSNGQVYAGRTLVYEDCRRDLELDLGAPFLAELAPALSMVLASARWFTHYVATRHREQFHLAYDEMTAESGPVPVHFLPFALASLPRILNPETKNGIEAELQARWRRVISPPEGVKQVAYSSAELLPRAQEEFGAPGPGWQKARNHSPDVLIAAPSLEAIRQGDYQIVLGEVHLALNTLDRELFFGQHPHPDRLAAAIESDLPEPSLIPRFAKYWNHVAATTALGLSAPAVNSRMDVSLRSAKDFYLDFSIDAPGIPNEQLLPIGDLVVEKVDGELYVRPLDGRPVRFEIIDFFQLVMMMQLLVTFEVLPEGIPAEDGSTHTPRVTIDRVVISRESWSFLAPTVEAAAAPTPSERFAAIAAWAHRVDLPRFFFCKTPTETKPFYVDLASPILVEHFAKAVRQVAAATRLDGPPYIHLSEMIPEHERLWLPDAADKRYTSELRMVAVDLEGRD